MFALIGRLEKYCYLEITVDPDEEAVDKGDEEDPDDIPRLYPFCSGIPLVITVCLLAVNWFLLRFPFP